MTLDYLRSLVDFHYWARDRMLQAVSLLDAVQYSRAVDGSFGSVRETLNHIYGAEVVWLRRWQGESPTAFPGQPPESVAALRAAWKQQERALRAFVSTLDEQSIHRVVAYRSLAGVAGESAIWEMLVHVVNHATYHRGQVTTLLRQLGAAPPASTDLIAYFRLQRAGTTTVPAAVHVRPADANDAATIAALHAASWRRAYRGILSDAFLDGDLDAERLALWSAKLASPTSGCGWLAFVNDEPAGFVFVRPYDDAEWGTLIDNLHVSAMYQGNGIGRRLLHTVGEWAEAHVTAASVHLWVFADNRAARGFYARAGGREIELVDREASDGRVLPEYRVAWSTARELLNPDR